MKIEMKQNNLLLEHTRMVVYLLIISVVLAVALLATSTASATGTETISISSATIDKNSTAVVQLSIANAVEITGLSLDLSYDPAVIEVLDISVNEDVTGSSVVSDVDNLAGKTCIALTNIDTINSVESVSLVDIVINAIGEANDETALTLQNVEIANMTFLPTPVESIVNGLVKIDNGNLGLPDTTNSEIKDNTIVDNSVQNDSTNDKSNGDEDSATRYASSSSQANTLNKDTSGISSATDQPEPAIPGFGLLLTVLSLLFINKIHRNK